MGKDSHRPNDSKSSYFQLPHPVVVVAVTVGLGLTALCYYCPDSVPYTYMGPLGTLARYFAVDQPVIIKWIWYFAVVTHVGEAVYSLSASSAKGLEGVTKMKWFVSTLCLGFFSLRLLKSYAPLKS
ncbi:putative transmembrane protein [Apostichopus japonicus]|uniref:Transmembrane protein 254 n=1 Tax=Stichopus japonicus TaxID=307972 RepID=A0A2G8KKT9_STIJA|nr:putative transmembrane protein [Apostichopus japonicus]